MTIIAMIIIIMLVLATAAKTIKRVVYRFLGDFPAILVVPVSPNLFQDELSAVFPLHVAS